MKTKSKLIAKFQKDPTAQIRLLLAMYKGEVGLDLRTFRKNGWGRWTPTPSGIRLAPDLLPELIHALVDAVDALQANGEELS